MGMNDPTETSGALIGLCIAAASGFVMGVVITLLMVSING